MQKTKKYKWKIFAAILAAAELVMSIWAAVEVCILNMLPEKLLIAAIVILAAIEILTVLLLIPKGRNKKWCIARRVLGSVLAIAAIAIDSLLVFYVGNLNHTVTAISTDSQSSNVVAIYVRADDEAADIDDVIDYIYGVSDEFDYENTILAKEAIEDQISGELSYEIYESITDMVDHLYNEKLDAIIINQAYIGLLSDQKKYANIEKDLKVIYEYQIPIEEESTEKAAVSGNQKAAVSSNSLSISQRPFIVYISGSDTRTTTLQTSRSDVNLLVVVNPVSQQVLLLNTPRDYYIETSHALGQLDKLTHCGLYGIDCSMQTLGNLYGEEVEYYAQINFDGFSRLATAIGGVVVENEKSFTSVDGFYYPAGSILLDGDRALHFVRERKAFASGDNQRGKNQMKVVKAMIEKVKTSDTILTNYTDILESLEGMFVTNVTPDEMAELVRMQLDKGLNWNVLSYGVSGTGASRTTYTVPAKRAYVTIPDESTVEKARQLIDKVYAGDVLTENDLSMEAVSENTVLENEDSATVLGY